MNTKKILIAIAAAVGLFRIWVLLRQKGFREFPLYFFGFAIGLLLVVASINRYNAGDTSGRMAEDSVGSWYQDVGIGFAFMLVAISGSWACLSRGTETQADESKVFTPEDWEKFDAELSETGPPPPPELEEIKGLSEITESVCVLHSFDTALVQRIGEQLDQQDIGFDSIPVTEDSGLQAWEVSVESSNQTLANTLISEVEEAYRIETSTFHCQNCGTGMLLKPDIDEEDLPEVLTYVCSKCGAERIEG